MIVFSSMGLTSDNCISQTAWSAEICSVTGHPYMLLMSEAIHIRLCKQGDCAGCSPYSPVGRWSVGVLKNDFDMDLAFSAGNPSAVIYWKPGLHAAAPTQSPGFYAGLSGANCPQWPAASKQS